MIPSELGWYWRRLRVMGGREIASHAHRRLRQTLDSYLGGPMAAGPLEPSGAFPQLPLVEAAPEGLHAALARDVARIRAGCWRAFGHLELQVDTPPRWHKDYLAGVDLATTQAAAKLNHRVLPDGADIKLIWELSRWHELTRLAMGAYLLDDRSAAVTCLSWMADWAHHNPPYRGWNWTSPLEAGIRLIQCAWIDALIQAHEQRDLLCRPLEPGGEAPQRLSEDLAGVWGSLLPAHAHFVWRYRSSGTSANNHLVGELAGLIVAVARWPDLSRFCTTLARLQELWEQQVIAQFASDGGNAEQALNYHLFSWELCCHARTALRAVGRTPAAAVEERLERGAEFFVDLQVPTDPWDYGDSDGAFVAPLFVDTRSAIREWYEALSSPGERGSLRYWLGAAAVPAARTGGAVRRGWTEYPRSGYAVWRDARRIVRLDWSPLGYLATAAHGHLDALHVSVWFDGRPAVVDPGTGAYFADPALRHWLASSAAHNAPRPISGEVVDRLGPFLWASKHPLPQRAGDLNGGGRPHVFAAELDTGSHVIRRCITVADSAIHIDDMCVRVAGGPVPEEFTVRWQFSPGAELTRLGRRQWRILVGSSWFNLEVTPDWAGFHGVAFRGEIASSAREIEELKFAGIVSPTFRGTRWAPFVKLVAAPTPGRDWLFRTTLTPCEHG